MQYSDDFIKSLIGPISDKVTIVMKYIMTNRVTNEMLYNKLSETFSNEELCLLSIITIRELKKELLNDMRKY